MTKNEAITEILRGNTASGSSDFISKELAISLIKQIDEASFDYCPYSEGYSQGLYEGYMECIKGDMP